MRIGISALLTEGGRSGIGQYIVNLLGALQEVDQANQYVVFGLAGDRSLEGVTAPNFTVVRVPGLFRRPIPSILWHWVVLPILARRWRLDLLHLPSYRRLCPLSPCPVVVTVHDLAVLRVPAKYGRLRNLYVRVVIRRLLKRSARIVTVSESTRQDVLASVALTADHIAVVYNGIDHKRYHPMDLGHCRAEVTRRYAIRPPFILCVARLEHPGKNLVRLIEAFTYMKVRAGLRHQLILAGAPWSGAEAIDRAARESGAAADIVFPGFVPTEDLPLLYNAADLLVLPSLHEGFGFPVLEAMACGVPVACAATGSLPEVAGARARLFDPYDVQAMAAALREVLTDAAARERARAEGPIWAARFTWDRAARTVLDLYSTIATSHR